MEIKYRPGKLHQNADALSRNPICLIVNSSYKIDDWLVAQHEDPFCQRIMIENARPIQDGRFDQVDEFKILNNGLLATSRDKIVVTTSLQLELLEAFHDHKMAATKALRKRYLD